MAFLSSSLSRLPLPPNFCSILRNETFSWKWHDSDEHARCNLAAAGAETLPSPIPGVGFTADISLTIGYRFNKYFF